MPERISFTGTSMQTSAKAFAALQYSLARVVMNQTGATSLIIRETGDNVADQNLAATTLSVGSVISGEITYTVF